MRAVVQRVRSAEVRVGAEVVGAIGEGLLVYVGVGRDDGSADARYLAKKVAGLRVFPDEQRSMNRTVLEWGGEALVVSQFTLYGDCRKGRRPSFSEAKVPEEASELIDEFCVQLEGEGLRAALGSFGAMMDVESLNWGPVTILIDSKKSF